MTPTATAQFRAALHAWYAAHARPMPWRQTADPYPIWVSEIMLQQTTVTAVVPYYLRFMQRFPTVQALAQAEVDDVLHHWQGLGYYRRAHLLHRCAQVVAQQLGGVFPSTQVQLLALPGVGPYTAAAITALAFNAPASVLDGNVERVTSRLFAIPTPFPAAKPQLRTLAAQLADPAQPRRYANAIMELGATVCTPTSPACSSCPVQAFCTAYAQGTPTAYPVKTPKKALPTRSGTTMLLQQSPSGPLWLQQRPASGLLAGLYQPPNWGWETHANKLLSIPHSTPIGTITHTFTHFHLTLQVYHAYTPNGPGSGQFYPLHALPPMPTLFKKVTKLLLDAPPLLA